MSALSIGDHDLAEIRRLAPLVLAGPDTSDREGTWRGRVTQLAQRVACVLEENDRRPLPAELPLTEDHVRELQAEENRLRVQHEQTGERLAAINAVLVASGEARIRQRQEAQG